MFSACRRLYAPLSRQFHSFVQAKSAAGLPDGFDFFPKFLSPAEQRTLLSTALSKLDSIETKQARKRRKVFLANHLQGTREIEDLFLPDEYYDFQEVAHHLDGQEFDLWKT